MDAKSATFLFGGQRTSTAIASAWASGAQARREVTNEEAATEMRSSLAEKYGISASRTHRRQQPRNVRCGSSGKLFTARVTTEVAHQVVSISCGSHAYLPGSVLPLLD